MLNYNNISMHVLYDRHRDSNTSKKPRLYGVPGGPTIRAVQARRSESLKSTASAFKASQTSQSQSYLYRTHRDCCLSGYWQDPDRQVSSKTDTRCTQTYASDAAGT